jgi:hypothetical protein
MNVLYQLTTVIQTQPAPTVMDLSCALVTLGTLEMGRFAKVNLKKHLQHTKALFSKIEHEARNFVIFF